MAFYSRRRMSNTRRAYYTPRRVYYTRGGVPYIVVRGRRQYLNR